MGVIIAQIRKNEKPPRRPPHAVASRQRGRNSSGRRRLAAEIPDIFIPLARNDVRNDDVVFFFGGCSSVGVCVDHGSGHSAPCRLRRDGTRRFCFGVFFTCSELGNDTGLMGALLPFVLRVVAGACVGRGSGQPRMPPRERQHEGFWFFVWGILSHAWEWTARGLMRFKTAKFYGPLPLVRVSFQNAL